MHLDGYSGIAKLPRDDVLSKIAIKEEGGFRRRL